MVSEVQVQWVVLLEVGEVVLKAVVPRLKHSLVEQPHANSSSGLTFANSSNPLVTELTFAFIRTLVVQTN